MTTNEAARAPATPASATTRFTPFGAMLMQFFAFGIGVGLWSGSVPFVTKAAGMSTQEIGTAFTIYSAAYIAAMAAGGKLMSFISPRRILLASVPLMFVALTGLLLATSPARVLIFLTSSGFLIGLCDLVMNAEGTLVEADLQRPILARLHGSAAASTAIGALAGSIFALTLGQFASVAFNFVFVVLSLAFIFYVTPQRPVVHRASGGIWATYSTALLVFGLIFGIDVAGETAASIWSARLLEEQAPQLAVIAGIGVTFFCGCQAIMRFMGDQLRRALGDQMLILMSLLIALVGFAVVGLSATFAMSVIGFALVGIGTAMLVPCLFASAARSRPASSGAALSLVATIAGGPRLVAPWAFGEIASRWSTGIAFGVVAASFLIAVGLAISVLRQSRTA